MNVSRFRSIRRRLRWRFVLPIAVVAFLVLRCSQSPDYDVLDASTLVVESGTYTIHGVTKDSRLTVSMPQRLSGGGRELKEPIQQAVKLLAVDVRLPRESQALLVQLVDGQSQVELRFDRRRLTEDKTELQAYAYAGRVCLNEELIRTGVAKEATHPSDAGPMIRLLKKAEAEAREQRRGIWE